MSSLTDLPEIGPVIAKHLVAVGITDADELRRLGAKEAFLRIRDDLDPDACVHMLQALEAGIQGVRTTGLDPATKQELNAWLRHLDAANPG